MTQGQIDLFANISTTRQFCHQLKVHMSHPSLTSGSTRNHRVPGLICKLLTRAVVRVNLGVRLLKIKDII